MPIYRHNKNTVSKALVLLSYNSVTLTANVSPPATLISAIRSQPVQPLRELGSASCSSQPTAWNWRSEALARGGECFASSISTAVVRPEL